MARLEDFYNGPFINGKTRVTVMRKGGWQTSGAWYQDNILAWLKKPVKAAWYDAEANELNVTIDDEEAAE